jgi:DNA-binding protein H-NS
MKTYASLKAQIVKLEREAEKLRKAEVSGVISRIKEAIAAYGLTHEDLGLSRSLGKRAVVKGRGETRITVGEPKYRDPKTGKTWTGRGKPPNWIVSVKNRDRFLIDASESSPGVELPNEPARRKRRVSRKASTPAAQSAAVQIEGGVGSQ